MKWWLGQNPYAMAVWNSRIAFPQIYLSKNIHIFFQTYFKALISRADQHTFDPCRALPVTGTLDSGLPKDGNSAAL